MADGEHLVSTVKAHLHRRHHLTEVDFGELTYEDGTPLEISITYRYDNAVLQY